MTYEKDCECPMIHTIEQTRREVDKITTKLEGDGNGIKGISRRMDTAESRQEITDLAVARIEKMFMAIITAIIISIILTLLPRIYAPQDRQNARQTAAPVKAGDAPAYDPFTAAPAAPADQN